MWYNKYIAVEILLYVVWIYNIQWTVRRKDNLGKGGKKVVITNVDHLPQRGEKIPGTFGMGIIREVLPVNCGRKKVCLVRTSEDLFLIYDCTDLVCNHIWDSTFQSPRWGDHVAVAYPFYRYGQKIGANIWLADETGRGKWCQEYFIFSHSHAFKVKEIPRTYALFGCKIHGEKYAVFVGDGYGYDSQN